MNRRFRTRCLATCGVVTLSAWLGLQSTLARSPVSIYANQFPSLQAAVNALPREGGTVILGCGTYGAVTISRPVVTLVGQGDCTIITAPASGTSNIVTVTNHATGTVISDLSILGQAEDQGTIQRCVNLTGGSTGTTIQQVKFGGTTSYNGCNIQIHSDSTSSRNLITHNTLTQAIGTGSGGGYGMLIETSDANTITHNASVQTATQGRHHIYLSAGSSFNVVMDNQLTGGTSDQVAIYALDTQPTGQYNVIEGNVLSGMVNGLGAVAAIHIAHNAAFNHVIGNQVIEAAVTGIEVEASSAEDESHSHNNDVEDNEIYFTGQFGIHIYGPSDTMVRGNTVYEASQTSPGTYAGIGVSSHGEYAPAQKNLIIGNTSYGSATQRCGLRIDPGPPPSFETVVTNNRFGVGTSGSAFVDEGLDTVIGANILDYQNPHPPQHP